MPESPYVAQLKAIYQETLRRLIEITYDFTPAGHQRFIELTRKCNELRAAIVSAENKPCSN